MIFSSLNNVFIPYFNKKRFNHLLSSNLPIWNDRKESSTESPKSPPMATKLIWHTKGRYLWNGPVTLRGYFIPDFPEYVLLQSVTEEIENLFNL